ncbi:3-hydroxyisobutyrate dehydrogenase [Sphingobium wenxiniae]|uniref:Oxidoreductase n=2 Tax=Sphingobium TaxID=165695 RepID=T0GB70_9SPHN|nr:MULTISPECIES: NAD(P)-dependent oxidoreductase [Sphingobium]EQA97871.1 oxidoreductase [Sphingobium baderi LL03]KMS63469.1 oxidoreductase [Sphingobium baderi LL03]MBB6190013.1 3-hydroxyisobutyrate dehydrogenase [Sphingobium wenxiniae]TWH97672.1 3-hydroxyisobutyrate dehydrogenase [Sphingobium wenxiniae]WRD77296.1 NAD(P)-dependent oxidoreductase [Sphingobium baderi]
MANIAFIGLGVMGGPIAGHLAKAGHRLTVYNRSIGKAKSWAEAYGGEVAINPAKAAEDAEIVISCVGTDDDLSQITLGREGVFRAMKPGSLFIDHTTVSARIARQLYVEGQSLGLYSVDAPLTGGQIGAEHGTLSIMCGGAKPAVAAAKIVMQAYAARIVHVGGAGAGQTTKMVNQICLAGTLQGVAEALRFAQAANLDVEKIYEAISGGAAQSWVMDNQWKTMAQDNFDFGLSVDWMRKDLELALDEARANGATLPMTALVDQFYADVQAMGGHRQDISALVRRITRA